MPGRTLVSWFPRGAPGFAALVIVSVLLLGTPFMARASLLKPTYAAGDQRLRPIASHGTKSYRADVTYFSVTTPLAADLPVDASTSISPIPRFDLDVGQSANATLDTHLELNSTFTIFQQTTTMQNSTNV